MTEPTLHGIFLVSLAGAMSGTFSVPMKFTKRWEWEHIWGSGSLCALVLGWILAFAALPDIFDIYVAASAKTLLATFLFGLGWGAGAILFGLGVLYVGVGLGVTIILALTAVVGSIVPLLIQHPDRILQPPGIALLCGLGLMIVGIILLGRAGQKRDVETRKSTGERVKSFLAGVLICILSGLLSPLANFAFAFGSPLVVEASGRHGMGWAASTAPWALAFTGCYGLNVLYCSYLIKTRRTADKLWMFNARFYWLGAAIMGILWVGAMLVYGWGAARMGAWGLYLGFPLFMIVSIVVANLWSGFTGEWNKTSSATKLTLLFGLCILTLAFITFGIANSLLS